MSPTRAWLIYVTVRVLAFAIPFLLLLWLIPFPTWNWVAALVIGTLVSLSVSEIFLTKPRAVMSQQLYERRARRKPRTFALNDEEDALLDDHAAEPAASTESDTNTVSPAATSNEPAGNETAT